MGLFHSKVAHTFFRLRNLFFRQKTADAAHLIVEIETGRLRGKESKAYYSRKKYCSFLGVPFAKPPVEDLRFRVSKHYFHSVPTYEFVALLELHSRSHEGDVQTSSKHDSPIELKCVLNGVKWDKVMQFT